MKSATKLNTTTTPIVISRIPHHGNLLDGSEQSDESIENKRFNEFFLSTVFGDINSHPSVSGGDLISILSNFPSYFPDIMIYSKDVFVLISSTNSLYSSKVSITITNLPPSISIGESERLIIATSVLGSIEIIESLSIFKCVVTIKNKLKSD